MESLGRKLSVFLEGISPGVGLKPKTEQKEAGFLNDPIISEPSANGIIPVETAAAPPPLDPPDVSSISNGFFVDPKISLYVCEPIPNSGTFVFPNIKQPDFFKLLTIGESIFGMFFWKIFDPKVVSIPCVSSKSFIAIGKPSNGECLLFSTLLFSDNKISFCNLLYGIFEITALISLFFSLILL